jgi:poly-gamma-glutamate synthesis protein (capsule biosynthesis protein)
MNRMGMGLREYTVRAALVAVTMSCHAPNTSSATVGAARAASVPGRERAARALVPSKSTTTEAPFSPLKLRFLGDVILGRYRAEGFRAISGEGGPVLRLLNEWLHGDMVLGNLETPVVATLPAKARARAGSFFGATPEMLAPLAASGISHLGLANNHAHDLGRQGLVETPGHVERVGIVPIGGARLGAEPDRFQTITLGKTTVHIAAVTTLRNFEPKPSDPQVPYIPVRELGARLAPAIAKLPRDELIIVFVHWGQEDDPSPGPWERRAAHEWVDAGADLVIGHHPHVLQEIELYSGAVIAYSLGNFLFDSIMPKRRVGAILAVNYLDADWCDAQITLVPTEIHTRGGFHPEPAARAAALIAHRAVMRRSSATTLHPPWKVDGTLLVGEVHRAGCPKTP